MQLSLKHSPGKSYCHSDKIETKANFTQLFMGDYASYLFNLTEKDKPHGGRYLVKYEYENEFSKNFKAIVLAAKKIYLHI